MINYYYKECQSIVTDLINYTTCTLRNKTGCHKARYYLNFGTFAPFPTCESLFLNKNESMYESKNLFIKSEGLGTH